MKTDQRTFLIHVARVAHELDWHHRIIVRWGDPHLTTLCLLREAVPVAQLAAEIAPQLRRLLQESK